MSNWADLPSELLEVISLRVCSDSISSYVQCNLICKPWKIIFGKKPRRKNAPLLIMELKEGEHHSRCRLFSIVEGNFCRRFDHPDLPRLNLSSSVGCGYGWIVGTSTNKEFCERRVYLFNPITQREISLPSTRSSVFIINVAMSSNPISDNNEENCYVAGFFCCGTTNKYLLACCKVGDEKWNFLQGNEKLEYLNIAYCDGVLYGLDMENRNLVICYIEHSSLRIKTHAKLPEFIAGNYPGYCSLLESNGELLFIRRYGEYGEEVLKFTILKLDKYSQDWSELKSLGDRSIFSSVASYFSFSTLEYPGFKPNSVYFVQAVYAGQDRCGIFNLAGSMIEYLQHNLEPPFGVGFWIEPSW